MKKRLYKSAHYIIQLFFLRRFFFCSINLLSSSISFSSKSSVLFSSFTVKAFSIALAENLLVEKSKCEYTSAVVLKLACPNHSYIFFIGTP